MVCSADTLNVSFSYENIILTTFGKKMSELIYKSKKFQGGEVKQENGSSLWIASEMSHKPKQTY